MKLKDASTAVANALRRNVLSQQPCFAIDEVDFYENNSCMFNEYLANRIGLTPLTYEEGVSDDAKISLTMDVEGPCTVYSKDFKSTDKKIAPFCQNIPIIKLNADQRLRVEALAVKGTAKQHAKFQCAHASYSYSPDLAINKDCDNCEKCINACPKKLINKKLKIERPDKCDLCAACVEACPKQAAKITGKEGEYFIHIESYNNIPAQKHLINAAKTIKQNAEALQKELK